MFSIVVATPGALVRSAYAPSSARIRSTCAGSSRFSPISDLTFGLPRGSPQLRKTSLETILGLAASTTAPTPGCPDGAGSSLNSGAPETRAPSIALATVAGFAAGAGALKSNPIWSGDGLFGTVAWILVSMPLILTFILSIMSVAALISCAVVALVNATLASSSFLRALASFWLIWVSSSIVNPPYPRRFLVSLIISCW